MLHSRSTHNRLASACQVPRNFYLDHISIQHTLAIKLRHESTTQSAAAMITTLRSGSPVRSQSNSITGIFSSSSVCRLCCPSRRLALTQISHARGVLQLVSQPLVGLVTLLLVLLGLQGALSLVFLCCLAQGSFQLVVADHWLHVLFNRALACSRVQDVGVVRVENVTALISSRILWIAAASRMIFSLPQGLKMVITPLSAPFFADQKSITSRLTRISLPWSALNWTFLSAPQCRRGSPSTLSNDNVCSSSTM